MQIGWPMEEEIVKHERVCEMKHLLISTWQNYEPRVRWGFGFASVIKDAK